MVKKELKKVEEQKLEDKVAAAVEKKIAEQKKAAEVALAAAVEKKIAE